MIREIVREILGRYGKVYEFPKNRSFDFVYDDDVRRLIIKALSDLESLRRSLAEDLKRFSKTFRGSPLVVSVKRRNEPLMRGVAYIRYGIPAVSPETLEDSLRGMLPKFLEYRGGLRMFLSREVLKNVSRSYLSEILEVSKKSVYEYERGMGVSASKYERVVRILGEDAVEAINIFSWEVDVETGEPKNEIDQIIARLAEEFDEALRFYRRPGRTALLNNVIRIIFTLRKSEAARLYEASDVTKTSVVLIGDDDELPSIKLEELDKMKKEDLIELVS